MILNPREDRILNHTLAKLLGVNSGFGFRVHHSSYSTP